MVIMHKRLAARQQKGVVDSPARQAPGVYANSAPAGFQRPLTILQRAQADPKSISVAEAAYLQRTIGNRAIGHFLQAKTKLGPAGDKYEQEAESTARHVMSAIASSEAEPHANKTQRSSRAEALTTVQRESLQSILARPVYTATAQHGVADRIRRIQRHEKEEGNLQASPQHGLKGGEVDEGVATAIEDTKGGGRSLPDQVRASMERGFGADFSAVRVHTGGQADALNHSLNAKAFTTGRDIFFAKGQYNPQSRSGQELIAHELTHTVQQGAVQTSSDVHRAMSVPRDSARVQREPVKNAEERKEIRVAAARIRADLAIYFAATATLGSSVSNTPGFRPKHEKDLTLEVPQKVREAANRIQNMDIRMLYWAFFDAVDKFLKDESLFKTILENDRLYGQLYAESLYRGHLQPAIRRDINATIDTINNYIFSGKDREMNTSWSKAREVKLRKEKNTANLLKSRASSAKKILPLLEKSNSFQNVQFMYKELKKVLDSQGAGAKSGHARKLFNQQISEKLEKVKTDRKNRYRNEDFMVRYRANLMETNIAIPGYDRSLLTAIKNFRAHSIAVNMETLHDVPDFSEDNKENDQQNNDDIRNDEFENLRRNK